MKTRDLAHILRLFYDVRKNVLGVVSAPSECTFLLPTQCISISYKTMGTELGETKTNKKAPNLTLRLPLLRL
jgi:hypothetical protein